MPLFLYCSYTMSQSVRYLIFYNLKKPEPMFTVVLALNILIILASKSIYNLASNLTITYSVSQKTGH